MENLSSFSEPQLIGAFFSSSEIPKFQATERKRRSAAHEQRKLEIAPW
jgi:hypothetical protein